MRTFALDGFRAVDWLRGDHFDYPADFRREQLTEGAFGLVRGESTRVRIIFAPKVARYLQRHQWYPTQHFRRVDGGIEMTMDVRGTTELAAGSSLRRQGTGSGTTFALQRNILAEVGAVKEAYVDR